MDFDNPKVYDDTSIFYSLVLIAFARDQPDENMDDYYHYQRCIDPDLFFHCQSADEMNMILSIQQIHVLPVLPLDQILDFVVTGPLMSRVKNNKRPRTVSLAKWITHTSYRRESVFLSSKEYKIPTTADKHRWPTQFLKHSEKIPSDRTFNIKCLVFWEIFQNTKACIVFVKVKGWEDGEGCQVVLSNFRRVNKKYCN